MKQQWKCRNHYPYKLKQLYILLAEIQNLVLFFSPVIVVICPEDRIELSVTSSAERVGKMKNCFIYICTFLCKKKKKGGEEKRMAWQTYWRTRKFLFFCNQVCHCFDPFTRQFTIIWSAITCFLLKKKRFQRLRKLKDCYHAIISWDFKGFLS